MNETLVKLLSNPEVASVKMELFSVWHIIYVAVIILLPLVLAHFLRHSAQEKQTNALKAVALAVFFIYIGDFFLQPFYNDGEMIVDKLPFHICTFLCPVLMVAQFSQCKKIHSFYDAIVLLSIVGPFMYFVYPNTAFGDTYTPWCYRVVQTFLYHGTLYCWGVLALLLGHAKCKPMTLVKVLLLQAIITVWASLGNAGYDHNWYFLQGLDLGFVELKHPWTYLLINLGVFLMVLIVYGIAHLAASVSRKKAAKVCS